MAEGQFHIDVGGFLRTESEEIFGVPNPVSLGFKPAFFVFIQGSCFLVNILLVSFEPAFTNVNHVFRRLGGLFLEDRQNQHGVWIEAICVNPANVARRKHKH